MKEYDLDYEDAIHLAVAIRTCAQEILSNDKDFDLAPIASADVVLAVKAE
jgi:predicted nucleic acid-binding protein